MHKNFADWYQPVTFGHDRETLDFRWRGVEAALENLDYEMLMDLVRFVFSREIVSQEVLSTFRQYFKDTDQTFLTTGNEQEVLTLASCVLALICVDEYSLGEIALAILTVSACGIRKPAINIDLVGMATERVKDDGLQDRSRPIMSAPKKVGNKKAFQDATEPLTQGHGFPQALEAIDNIGAITLSHINAMQKNTSEKIVEMQKVLKIQDEELQMLWWVVGNWSGMWNSSFNNIDPSAMPILLAEEAASMTTGFSEPPSLKSVFFRIGLDDTSELSITDSVNACGIENLEVFSLSNVTCASIFPVHFAMARAKETGADKSWVTSWRNISGIKAKDKITPVDLAVQFHRESKLMEFIGKQSE
ncbi:MAG: GTPase-associated system all-helical protein GASH [Woeseiaceae bacterium]